MQGSWRSETGESFGSGKPGGTGGSEDRGIRAGSVGRLFPCFVLLLGAGSEQGTSPRGRRGHSLQRGAVRWGDDPNPSPSEQSGGRHTERESEVAGGGWEKQTHPGEDRREK